MVIVEIFMKKTLFYLLASLILISFSCASKPVESEKIENSSEIVEKSVVEESVVESNYDTEVIVIENQNPEEEDLELTENVVDYLDSLWAQYFATRDETLLDKIYGYIDGENYIEKAINDNLETFKNDEILFKYLSGLGDFSEEGYKFLLDYELVYGQLLNFKESNQMARYLSSYIPVGIIIRATMKTTALWDFHIYSEKDSDVNLYFQKKYLYMTEEKRYANDLLYEGYDIPLVVGKQGLGVYTAPDQSFFFLVGLVNDVKAEIERWDSLPPESGVKLEVSQITSPETRIGPFIIHNLTENVKVPLYYDCEILNPKGISITNQLKNLLLAENVAENPEMAYRFKDFFELEIPDDDEAGTYKMKIFIHTGEEILCAFDLDFEFVK